MQSQDKPDFSFYVLEGIFWDSIFQNLYFRIYISESIFQNLYCRTYILENAKKLDNNEKLR